MPPAVPFRGRAKWADVAVDLGLVVLGALLVWGVLVEVPDDVPAMRAITAYTAYAVVATLALALARAVTRQLPTLRRVERDGEEGWVVRAWPGDWWHGVALDLGLAVLAGWLAVVGLRAGGQWLVAALALAAAGVWFLGRFALSVTGRRSNETLWVTADSVRHDSTWGTVWCARSSVTDAAARRGSRLVLVLDGPARVRPCPRPWRRPRRTPPDSVVVDCSTMGHDAPDLARWIETEVAWA